MRGFSSETLIGQMVTSNWVWVASGKYRQQRWCHMFFLHHRSQLADGETFELFLIFHMLADHLAWGNVTAALFGRWWSEYNREKAITWTTKCCNLLETEVIECVGIYYYTKMTVLSIVQFLALCVWMFRCCDCHSFLNQTETTSLTSLFNDLK